MGNERGGRLTAPLHLLLAPLLLVSVLWACAPAAAATQIDPDRMVTVIAGVRVDLSPHFAVPVGSGMRAALSLQNVGDRPIARDLHVTLTDATGLPLEDAIVVVVAEMPAMSDGAFQIAARAEGGGRYVAHVVLPMPGTYAVQLSVTAAGSVGSLRFDLDIAS